MEKNTSAGTVSYTHLDVYKRQPYEIPEFIRQEFSYDPEGAYQASWGLAGKKD